MTHSAIAPPQALKAGGWVTNARPLPLGCADSLVWVIIRKVSKILLDFSYLKGKDRNTPKY